MILYNLKTNSAADYRITKFDNDLEVESSYLVSAAGCECPQGHKPTCRHRKMLPEMLDRVDTAWFFCFDDKTWHDPTDAYAPGGLEEEIEGLDEEGHEGFTEAGEGPGPSTLAAESRASPSQEPAPGLRGEPAPTIGQLNKAVKKEIEAGTLATIRQEPAPFRRRV